MHMTTEQEKSQVPYMSFGVFKSTNESLAEATVPSGPLDRRVLDQLSGADHGALVSGLTFLGYVDKERKATPAYRELIAAIKDPTQYKTALVANLIEKYAPIIGHLDISTGTISDLEKAFKAYGVSQGQMLTKTIRFYVKALQECGVSVSPHILKAKARSIRTTPKRPNKPSWSAPSNPANSAESNGPPKGFDRMPVPGLPQAFIQFPLELTPDQVDLFGAVVNVLKTFAKGKSGRTEEG
jgi:hypothetical protein